MNTGNGSNTGQSAPGNGPSNNTSQSSSNNSNSNSNDTVTSMDIDDEYAQLPRLAGVLETVKRHCNDAAIELSNHTRNTIWQLIVAEDRDLIAIIDGQTGREAQTKAVLELVRQRAAATAAASSTSPSSSLIQQSSPASSPLSSSILPVALSTSVTSSQTDTATNTSAPLSSPTSNVTMTSMVATTPLGTTLPTPTAMPSPLLVPVAVTASSSLMSLSPAASPMASATATAVAPSPSSSSLSSAAAVVPSLLSLSTSVDGITEIAFSGALDAFGKNKPPAIKASAKAMVNILTQLKANPRDVSKRKMRLDHIIVKKQIAEVPGALSFLQAAGFRASLEADKKNYLLIDETSVNVDIIVRAIELLNDRIATADSPAVVKPADTMKRECVSGCGFFGDSQWEGMCSQCFKNRGASAAKKSSTETKSAASVKCKKGCGFFGAERFGGMCSVCFGKEPKVVRHWRKKWAIVRIAVRAVRRFNLGKKPEQTDKKRCWNCRKKIGISGGLECRCGYIFCTSHRYPHEHACTFDFKEHHKRKLMAENRIVAGKKFDRIDEREDDPPPKDDSKGSGGSGSGSGSGAGGSSGNNGGSNSNAGNKSPRR